MNLPSDTPKLPKWIFLVGDAFLLAMVWFIVKQSARPITGMALVAIAVCVAVAVAIGAFPFVAEYARRQDEALDNRQRALQALAATVTSSADQIAIAASGLDRLAGIAQENFSQSDRLANQIKEKMAELDARLATAKTDDSEAAARLESVAKKIAKIVAEFEAAASRVPEPALAAQPAVALEVPPVLASQIVEIRPAVASSISPFTAPAPARAPAPVFARTPAPAPAPSPAPAPAPLPTPATEAVVPQKRVSKKPAPAAPVAPDLIPEPPPGRESRPAHVVPETPSPPASGDGATRLVVTAYIGIGNRLFIRGNGPGLSWDKGVPLTFVSIGKWRWENGPEFAAWVRTQHPKLVVEVVKRLADVPGFTLLPKRWGVERTFGWLMHCRRLVRDHEQTTASAAAWIYLAMLRLMLRRLA